MWKLNSMLILWGLSLGTLSVTAFKKIEKKRSKDPVLLGVWINAQMHDDLIVYKRAIEFAEDKAGFKLLPKGRLIKRQNSGWCGTPPISYANKEGRWKLEKGRLVLTAPFWGGTNETTYQIIAVTEEEIQLKWLGNKVLERR